MCQSRGSDNPVGHAYHQLIVKEAPDETAEARRCVRLRAPSKSDLERGYVLAYQSEPSTSALIGFDFDI
ncbi:MAG: hypothetical protein KYX61_07980 [Gammaproteobacteria bacterium]|nr:hypothetical protein [Gammaproteobacteria bacterium]